MAAGGSVVLAFGGSVVSLTFSGSAFTAFSSSAVSLTFLGSVSTTFSRFYRLVVLSALFFRNYAYFVFGKE